MFHFFEAKTKVQKNREIMRDTDLRMAKYGRRGLISNILVFCLCLFISDSFVDREPKLAVILSAGLLVTTIFRGYFLFRIDAIYPRAPNAWRNKYFISTLLGALWWSVIMISVTVVLNLHEEASLLWLYTVVFFSTTAHAFAPFKRFLSVYQFIGIVPAALSILVLGDFVGILYTVILLLFYWILHHHSDLMGDTYWGHLEANYNLTRKAETLEEEKRDTRASYELCIEYLNQLSAKCKAGELEVKPDSPAGESIQDFYRVITKDYIPQTRVFNVRHFLQYLVRQHQEIAEKKGIELETAISPALPSRLIGDPEMLGKVLDSIMTQAVAQSIGDLIIFEMEFIRDFGTTGQLLVMVTIQNSAAKRKLFENSNHQELSPSLDLILAKGFLEVMDGSMEFGDSAATNGKNLTLRARMSVAEVNPRLDYHRLEYKNKPVLLINPNARWLDHKRLELDTLGFDVKTVNDFKKAVAFLTQSINQGSAVETVVYTTLPGDEQAIEFANELLSQNDLKYINQFVICSPRARKYFQERLVNLSPTLHYVEKPSGLYEFEMAFNPVFCYSDAASEGKGQDEGEVLWYCADKHNSVPEILGAEAVRVLRCEDKKTFLKLLQDSDIKLIVVDCLDETAVEIIESARAYEFDHNLKDLVPIVAVGRAEQQRRMLEAGVDQFISADTLTMGKISELEFWLKSRHI